ncbi:hypothetical protein C0993_001897 [Termitomyces sp. T159_Od127]|nr:hypothetical protein C0993_001897 [Termitomyces sp. T159_Od127]
MSFIIPAQADQFMALGKIKVPASVSKYMACIEPLKEVPIERAFELVVTGARDYDELSEIVEEWARKMVPGSFISLHTTDLDTDLYIFVMDTWEATLKILRSERLFRKQCPDPTIATPCLLWDHNNNPLQKTTLEEQVFKGAD